MQNSNSKAGTDVPKSGADEVPAPCQTIAKPRVVRSPLLGDEMCNFEAKFVSKLYESINRKKEELIKQKLFEKGFSDLIEGIEKRRFPKICCVKQGDWSYYFADNDTDEGAFIVAIEEYKIKDNFTIDKGVNMTFAFNFKDSYNGEVSFKRRRSTFKYLRWQGNSVMSAGTNAQLKKYCGRYVKQVSSKCQTGYIAE